MEHLIGATIIGITGATEDSDTVVIETDRGTMRLYHEGDCCERVEVVDVTGDPADLVGGVVSVAEMR